ncbi:MAG: hypothetical protein Unbinned2819contig1004_15 [Prokaryotic dsDNA virus sp.]|nr:MAG: hypothetical protein Unbinned2819contig1004_15 [Prokaryotic dsDNA virus sp.]|tara:strand:+ start:910 stop:1233 length:324 start_codon:yes stop_codon:yes gene_type:complete
MVKMNFFDTLKNNKEKVETLLKKHPELKDNDNKLISVFWLNEIGTETIEHMTAFQLLQFVANSELTNPETIRRVRQKLQEQDPALRGQKYKKRKNNGNDTRNQIKNL